MTNKAELAVHNLSTDYAWPRDPECLHKMADTRSPTIWGYAYFIGAAGGPIKIGFSMAPANRLRCLRAENKRPDFQLLAIRPGGRARETAYHWQFDDDLIAREWFRPSAYIMAEIERLTPETIEWANLQVLAAHHAISEAEFRIGCFESILSTLPPPAREGGSV